MTMTDSGIQPARSGIAPENIQEIMDAEDGASSALLSGQQQYTTPDWFVEQCEARLSALGLPQRPATACDPQSGTGSLIALDGNHSTCRFGCDIDNRVKPSHHLNLITGSCVRIEEAIADLHPDLRFVFLPANPPFGKKWKTASGKIMDSTEWTWDFATRRGNFGYFLANASTLEKLGIPQHPYVLAYETLPAGTVWKGVGITLGVIYWARPKEEQYHYTPPSKLVQCWNEIKAVVDEEKAKRPDFNIYISPAGMLRTYLSQRARIQRRLGRPELERLARINNCHPLTLTTEKETRDLLASLVRDGVYTVQPEARHAIESALADVSRIACPIMDVNDWERVAYTDEAEELECVRSVQNGNLAFTSGRKYPVTSGTYRFTEGFKRNKIHWNEDAGQYTKAHECILTGQDRYLQLRNDRGQVIQFRDRITDEQLHFPELLLWEFFKKPTVHTLADVFPEVVQQNLAVLKTCQMMAGYEYYPGQLTYLAKVAAKDYALVAGATGVGKSLMAISLLAMKCPERALIIAPQGTMRSSSQEDDDDDSGSAEDGASQWLQEINRFAPYLQVFELFKLEDYHRILSLNHGTLPPGVYVTYYEAFFQNGARETVPESWDDLKLNQWARQHGLPELPLDAADKRTHAASVGKENDQGIRCILAPCLSTLIGRHFDMVLLDEAHKVCNLETNLAQMLIRLQPRYRYALTATPIPNIASNLFSLMGWLCVPDWFKDDRRNAAWPYARHEIGRFSDTFLSQERDLTEEEDKRKADPKWRGNCTKDSAVISSPARLLKLLKPTMAYIGKKDCNPKYQEARLVDVRVPMGRDQSVLYEFFLDRGHIPGHPLVRARRQTQWLRAICADPAGFFRGPDHRPKVGSNMNPKVVAILELVLDILSQGEQVVIINSRVGLSNTLQHRLIEAGVPLARIDSTIPAEQHAWQANLFKSGRARALLMGIKCAASHSFSQCRYEIIGSIEYSPGPLDQARGRVDRVNSRPGVTIYCILNRFSIEEVMFDTTATKQDAATICLMGRRVPRHFKPVDASEILANAVDQFDLSGATPEHECELKWPKLCAAIRNSLTARQSV